MSVAPIRKPDALAELTAALRELTAELRAQRRRSPPGLVDALREAFGASGRLTAAGVLTKAEREVRLWDALVEAGVDLEAPLQSRLVAVGMLLARAPGLELVARRRGGGIYRLQD